jgi:ATP/maltotriose-dependent transcriptional regulator MalT
LAVWADAAELLGAAGEPEPASVALTECARRARHLGDVLTTSRALAGLSRLGWAIGDPVQAREANRAAFAIARAAPEAQTWRFLQVGFANALARQGELDEAECLARDLVAEGPSLVGAMAQFPLVLVELDRGPTDKTARRLSRLLDAVGDVDVPFLRVPVLTARACWQLATGDPGAANVTIAMADDITIGPFDDFRHDRLVLAARATATLGDDHGLVSVEQSARALAAHPASRVGARAAADAVAGHLMRRRGEPSVAARRFEAAAGAWERAPRRVLAAEAWIDAAEAWRDAGDPDASRRAVDRANHTITALRLAPLGRRAAALAEQATVRARDHPQLRFLTCRELDVLELLAAGRTNREIGSALYLSEGTVRNYASSVFVKLGVTRRAEAAALAVRLGLSVEA